MKSMNTRRFKVIPCPTCNSPSSFIAYRALDIFRCCKCELVFAQTNESVIDTPDHFFGLHNVHFEAELAQAHRKAFLRKAYYERLLGHPIGSILEVGCGTAALANAWLDLGVDYTGIEFISDVAAEARARTKANILDGDFEETNLGKNFDVATAFQVVEHVGSPLSFLKKLNDSAELLHVDVPNHDSLVSMARKIGHKSQYGFIQPPEHMRAYTPISLRNAMELAGLNVLICKSVRNDDELFGQLLPATSMMHRAVYTASAAVGRSSLLVGIARGHPLPI